MKSKPRKRKPRVLAYHRISTNKQRVDQQKLQILEFCQRNHIRIDDHIEITVSSGRTPKQRRLEEVLSRLEEGDTLIVASLDRLGRSITEIIELVNRLIEKKVNLISIKENIRIKDGKQDIHTKTLINIFALFSELERDILRERTVNGLAAAKQRGKKLGRKKGALGKSKLDGKEEEIRHLLQHGVAKAAIARICGCSRTAMVNFIRSRRLDVPSAPPSDDQEVRKLIIPKNRK